MKKLVLITVYNGYHKSCTLAYARVGDDGKYRVSHEAMARAHKQAKVKRGDCIRGYL